MIALRNNLIWLSLAVVGVGIFTVVGCSKPPSPPLTAATSTISSSGHASTTESRHAAPSGPVASGSPREKDATADVEHPHKPGSHGGIIVPIGADSYHAEAVIEKAGEFRLLTLGKDESRIQEVDLQSIKAYVKIVGQPDATPVELTASPQDGDTEGKTSQFVGTLPEDLRGKPLEVTIPNLRINGERFRVGFTTATAAHQEDMPAGLPAAEEQSLYLTPGGKYSLEDIEANGRTTASQKFRGILSSHDMKPKLGDRICPVTLTKANPKFRWVIDGKPYEFCCPPCVDEFVKLAKEQPEDVRDPDTYIK
jgi:YHS domain-containing protein